MTRQEGGKLHVDVQIERTEQHELGKDEWRVQGTRLRVVKMVQPEEKVHLELAPGGKKETRTRLEVTFRAARDGGSVKDR